MKNIVLSLLCCVFIACSHQPTEKPIDTVIPPVQNSPFEEMVWFSDSTVHLLNNQISIDMTGRFAPYPDELTEMLMLYNPSVIYLAFVEVADTILSFAVSAYVLEEYVDLQYAYDQTVFYVSDPSTHQVLDHGMLSNPKNGTFYKVSLLNGSLYNTSFYLLKNKNDNVLYEFKITGEENAAEAAKEYLLELFKTVRYL